MELPPPRYGNHNGNADLLAGAKYPALGNPYYEYIQSLIKKAPKQEGAYGYIEPTSAIDEKVEAQELVHLTSDAYIRHQTH